MKRLFLVLTDNDTLETMLDIFSKKSEAVVEIKKEDLEYFHGDIGPYYFYGKCKQVRKA